MIDFGVKVCYTASAGGLDELIHQKTNMTNRQKISGAVVFTAVLFCMLITAQAGNQAIAQQRSEIAQELVELNVRAYELEQSAIRAMREPDLSRYEAEMRQRELEAQQKIGVATAYSCGGLETQAEVEMNCPSIKRYPGGMTTSGTVPTRGTTIACDARYVGKMVYLSFDEKTALKNDLNASGVYKCEDTGGKINGNRFDIYLDTIQEARQFGVQKVKFVVL